MKTGIKKITAPYSPSWLEHDMCGGIVKDYVENNEVVGLFCEKCKEEWKITKQK